MRHAQTVPCGYCNERVDSVHEDGICTDCHVHSLGDMDPTECWCSDCKENEREEQKMQNAPRFQLGTPDQECRYPVRTDGQHIGRIYRWHGAWYAAPAGHTEEIRVAAGSAGKELAAGYLVAMYELRQITPQDENEDKAPEPREFVGPVPLLHPRMAATPRNVEAAHKAMEGLAEFLWTPLGGYPGADNPWFLRCQLCGWQGPRYWSHLRGRNGNPPSTFRHPGCLDPEKVRAEIAAYRKAEEGEEK